MAAEEIQHHGSGTEVSRTISLEVVVQRRRGRPTTSEAVDVVVNNKFSVDVYHKATSSGSARLMSTHCEQPSPSAIREGRRSRHPG